MPKEIPKSNTPNKFNNVLKRVFSISEIYKILSTGVFSDSQ
jgi:hypothetical protein